MNRLKVTLRGFRSKRWVRSVIWLLANNLADQRSSYSSSWWLLATHWLDRAGEFALLGKNSVSRKNFLKHAIDFSLETKTCVCLWPATINPSSNTFSKFSTERPPWRGSSKLSCASGTQTNRFIGSGKFGNRCRWSLLEQGHLWP